MQLNYINKPHFDNGAIEKISEVLKADGIKNPLICTDPGLSSIGMTDKLRNLLSNEVSPTFFSGGWRANFIFSGGRPGRLRQSSIRRGLWPQGV